MPRRRRAQPQQPVRRSERIRLRKEAAEAAEAARIADLEQEEPEQLASQPRQKSERRSRAPNGVASGSGVTRRVRTPRSTPSRNMPATSTPFMDHSTAMTLFGRFMDGILQAARESYVGEGSEPTANLNRDERTTQSQRGWVSGHELHDDDAPITEELDIIISLHSSDSEPDLL